MTASRKTYDIKSNDTTHDYTPLSRINSHCHHSQPLIALPQNGDAAE